MVISAASNEELERYRCVHSEEKDEQLACRGAPDPEQSGSLKVESSQETRTFVELALDSLDGEQPLRSFCEGQDAQFHGGGGPVEGDSRPEQPSAGPSEEGLGQARRADGALNPSHFKGLGTEAAPTARSQGDMASCMSGDFEDGSAGHGAAMEKTEILASNCRHWHKGKRKLPAPAPAPIDYPGEERLQRRLLKNRRTAAASRDRKHKEMESLAVKVHTLEVDNAGLQQALRHRDAEILALRAQLPHSEQLVTIAVALQMPLSAAPAAPAPGVATPGWPPLRPGFPAWPPTWGHRRPDGMLGQEPEQAVHSLLQPASSLMQPASSFGLPVGAGPGRVPGSGGQLTGGFRPPHAQLLPSASLLGQPLTEQPLDSISRASLQSSMSSTETGAAWLQQLRSLSASGLSEARSGFICGLDGQYLCVTSGASLSSQEPPVPVIPAPCPTGQLEGQLLRTRSSSCPDLPPAGPTMEWAGGPTGGACPSGQLLRARSGSYPPQPQHMQAHVDRRLLASVLETSFSLPLPDPDSFDQMDFDNLWAHLN
ncbi:hypothetical protein COCOBI_19-1390 [Coccomyxa sp. Obi]|nr:hypothetical protein COCOBI_19-1390 [Coccomyxa sp. Obi]